MPGETISAIALVETFNDYNGRVSDGPYDVFMVRGESAWRREKLAPGAIRVGTLQIGSEKEHYSHSRPARVSFRVPSVPPGVYWVEVCNANCRLGFGDLEGGSLTIVASPLEAQLRAQIERLQSARWDANRDAGQSEKEAADARGRLEVAAKQVEVLNEEISQRDARIAALESRGTGLLPWISAGAVAVLVFLMSFAVFRGTGAKTRRGSRTAFTSGNGSTSAARLPELAG
jgi:hypothetical protein